MWNAVRFCRLGIVLRNKFSNNLIQPSMLKSQLIFSLRVIAKNKAFTLTSVFGLCVSIAVCVLVAEYVDFELSYDRFFSKHKNIYRLQHNRVVNGELLYKKAMSFPEIAWAMKENFPEIESVARLFPVSTNIEPVFTTITSLGERRSFAETDAYLADSTLQKFSILTLSMEIQLEHWQGKTKSSYQSQQLCDTLEIWR